VSVAFFDGEVRQAQHRLEKEKRRARWLRVLTLGLVDNNKRISAATIDLQRCDADYAKCSSLVAEAQELDKLLLQTIQLEGVRVSQHTFADVSVSLAAQYGLDWELLRREVLERDAYECQESEGRCDGPLQIHHIVPLSKGGTNHRDNLRTLCYYHHCLKHDHMRGHLNGNLGC